MSKNSQRAGTAQHGAPIFYRAGENRIFFTPRCLRASFTAPLRQAVLFGVSETWLRKGEISIHIDDYKFYPLSRETADKGSPRGGVGFLLEKRLENGLR